MNLITINKKNSFEFTDMIVEIDSTIIGQDWKIKSGHRKNEKRDWLNFLFKRL